MAPSIDKLASNLDDDQCKNFKEFYTGNKVLKFMMSQVIYSYEYIDSWEKFKCILQHLRIHYIAN